MSYVRESPAPAFRLERMTVARGRAGEPLPAGWPAAASTPTVATRRSGPPGPPTPYDLLCAYFLSPNACAAPNPRPGEKNPWRIFARDCGSVTSGIRTPYVRDKLEIRAQTADGCAVRAVAAISSVAYDRYAPGDAVGGVIFAERDTSVVIFIVCACGLRGVGTALMDAVERYAADRGKVFAELSSMDYIFTDTAESCARIRDNPAADGVPGTRLRGWYEHRSYAAVPDAPCNQPSLDPAAQERCDIDGYPMRKFLLHGTWRPRRGAATG